MRRQYVRYTLGGMVALAIALLSVWAQRQQTAQIMADLVTTDCLTVVSPTDFSYRIDMTNRNSSEVSVCIMPSPKPTAGMSVVGWEIGPPELRATVFQNLKTGANWNIRVYLGPNQSGVLTLRLKTAEALVSPCMKTTPQGSPGLPVKSWQFDLIDGE